MTARPFWPFGDDERIKSLISGPQKSQIEKKNELQKASPFCTINMNHKLEKKNGLPKGSLVFPMEDDRFGFFSIF